MRRAHFTVTGGDFDHRAEATVTITQNERHAIFTVRPKGSRKPVSLPLADVAEMILWRAAKAAAVDAARQRRFQR